MPPTVQAPGSKKGNRMEGAQGLRQRTRLESVVARSSPEPRDSSMQWVVEEKGPATTTRHSKANDTLVSSQAVRVDAKFWMLKVGNHYLIADVLINSQPITGG